MASEIRLNQYFLCLQPPHEVSNDIYSFKKSLSQQVDGSLALYSKPHISLIAFIQYDSAESTIVKNFGKLVKSKVPSNIRVQGFDYFVNNRYKTHTIYLKLFETESINALVREAELRFKRLLQISPSLPPYFIKNLHLTVDKQIPQSLFEKVWPDWRNKEYKNTFPSNSMTLLKTKAEIDPRTLLLKRAQNATAQIVKEFYFEGDSKNEPLQGKLF